MNWSTVRTPRGFARSIFSPPCARPAADHVNRVTACLLRVGGYVNCAPDYLQVPQVINGGFKT